MLCLKQINASQFHWFTPIKILVFKSQASRSKNSSEEVVNQKTSKHQDTTHGVYPCPQASPCPQAPPYSQALPCLHSSILHHHNPNISIYFHISIGMKRIEIYKEPTTTINPFEHGVQQDILRPSLKKKDDVTRCHLPPCQLAF